MVQWDCRVQELQGASGEEEAGQRVNVEDGRIAVRELGLPALEWVPHHPDEDGGYAQRLAPRSRQRWAAPKVNIIEGRWHDAQTASRHANPFVGHRQRARIGEHAPAPRAAARALFDALLLAADHEVSRGLALVKPVHDCVGVASRDCLSRGVLDGADRLVAGGRQSLALRLAFGSVRVEFLEPRVCVLGEWLGEPRDREGHRACQREKHRPCCD